MSTGDANDENFTHGVPFDDDSNDTFISMWVDFQSNFIKNTHHDKSKQLCRDSCLEIERDGPDLFEDCAFYTIEHL